MTTPEMLINREKTVTTVVMAFAKGDHNGAGNERMLITKHQDGSRRLELCESLIQDDESPAQAGLRCVNRSLWLFEHGEAALQTKDLKFIGLVEWPEYQQFVFQIGFLVPHKFVKDIGSTNYVPLDNLNDYWDRLAPSSVSALNGLPQITTLHQMTQGFFGGALAYA